MSRGDLLYGTWVSESVYVKPCRNILNPTRSPNHLFSRKQKRQCLAKIQHTLKKKKQSHTLTFAFFDLFHPSWSRFKPLTIHTSHSTSMFFVCMSCPGMYHNHTTKQKRPNHQNQVTKQNRVTIPTNTIIFRFLLHDLRPFRTVAYFQALTLYIFTPVLATCSQMALPNCHQSSVGKTPKTKTKQGKWAPSLSHNLSTVLTWA